MYTYNNEDIERDDFWCAGHFQGEIWFIYYYKMGFHYFYKYVYIYIIGNIWILNMTGIKWNSDIAGDNI